MLNLEAKIVDFDLFLRTKPLQKASIWRLASHNRRCSGWRLVLAKTSAESVQKVDLGSKRLWLSQVRCVLEGALTALLAQAVRIITREAPLWETVMSETSDLKAES